MRNLTGLICCLLLSSTLLFAGNSVFSFDDFPVKTEGVDVYASGMGEIGISDLFRLNMSLKNPSLAITANKVTFGTAIQFGYTKYKTKSGASFQDESAHFPYFHMIVPFDNHRIAFMYNSFMAGDTGYEEDIVDPSIADSVYTQMKRVEGQIYKVDLLYAYKAEWINVGLAYNSYYGSRYRYIRQDFAGTSMMNTANEISNTYKYRGGVTLGLSKKLENFSFGVTYTSGVKLVNKQKYTTLHSQHTETVADYELPTVYSVGLTYRFTDYLKAEVEIDQEMWAVCSDDYRDTSKFGFGLSFDPRYGYGKWYESIPLRTGFYFKQLPFEKNNEYVNETAATFGWSIPLQSQDKRIDFAVKYLMRGDVDKHGYADNSIFFTIGTNGFDVFSKRRKRVGHRDIPQADE